MAKAISARCPECQSTIHFKEQPGLGQLIICPECETELEVVRLSPLKLDWAFDEEFDYEDDDFDYDDDSDFDDDLDFDDDEDWDDEDWDADED